MHAAVFSEKKKNSLRLSFCHFVIKLNTRINDGSMRVKHISSDCHQATRSSGVSPALFVVICFGRANALTSSGEERVSATKAAAPVLRAYTYTLTYIYIYIYMTAAAGP